MRSAGWATFQEATTAGAAHRDSVSATCSFADVYGRFAAWTGCHQFRHAWTWSAVSSVTDFSAKMILALKLLVADFAAAKRHRLIILNGAIFLALFFATETLMRDLFLTVAALLWMALAFTEMYLAI